jgi:hypothetical protein
VRRLPVGLLPLAHAAALDVAFAGTVLLAPQGAVRSSSAWLQVPGLVLALTLPLLLLVTVVVALTCPLPAGPSDRRSLRRLQAATGALAGLGLALYVSPGGAAAVAAAVES